MRVIFVFPVHADFSGLLHFFSAVCPLGTPWSSCLSDSLPLRKYTAHSALHVLCWIIFPFYHLLKKTKNRKLHLSSAPSPLGKTSINTDLLLSLGACPFWCLLLSLRFLFIKIMPRKPGILPKVRVQHNAKEELRHTGRKHSKSVQIRLPIFIQKTPKCKSVDQSFK